MGGSSGWIPTDTDLLALLSPAVNFRPNETQNVPLTMYFLIFGKNGAAVDTQALQ